MRTAALAALALSLAGCATLPPGSISEDGALIPYDAIQSPVSSGEPQLSFNLLWPTAASFAPEAARLLAQNSPLQNVVGGESATSDVVLNYAPSAKPMGIKVTAVSAYTGETLFRCQDSLMTHGSSAQAIGAMLHAAFVPGGPLYKKVVAQRALGRKGAAPAAAAPLAAAPAAAKPRAPELDALPAARPKRAGAHALIIGIERYRGTLPPADYAAGDARAVAQYAKLVLGVPDANVALLTDENATRGDFVKYIERWLPNRVKANDEVFVFYSGHGAPNAATGDTYLVPYDGDPSYVEETAYPLKKLYESLGRLPARKVYVAMDSCFSGAGGRSLLAKGARPLVTVTESGLPKNLAVLSASGGDQISNSYVEKGHGLFTYFFLKGLKEKGPDMRAVYDYLKPQVADVARRDYNADQEPQWREGR